MALEGKRINELTEVSKVDISSKLAIDTGGAEALSITLKNLIDSSGVGSVDIATTEKAGIVKPDGTTISVSSDGTISSSGSGFDFEGTKAEFDAAVAAGTITDGSVSLITDDVSGDNVATKAELQDKVSKAGDTMTGPLKMSGENEVRFGTDDNYYTAAKQSNGNFVILKDNKGLFLHVGDNFKPYYVDGTNVYRLLTTADNGAIVGWLMPDYSSAITGNAVAGKFIQCPADAAVCVFGSDAYTEDFYAYVSPDNGTTKYIVGRRTDDVNGYTQTTSFYFLVPKNWYFTTTVEQGFIYQIYPLSGGQNA